MSQSPNVLLTDWLKLNWNEQVCQQLVSNGELDILKFMHHLNVSWPKHIIKTAVNSGQVHVAKWLMEQNIPWTGNVVWAAVEKGYLDFLIWIQEQSLQGNIFFPFNNYIKNHIGLNNHAAQHGHLDILKWLQVHSSEIVYNDPCVFASAAESGNLELMIWMNQQGYCWDEMAPMKAALNNHFHALKWLHAQNCPWDEKTCSAAAQSNNLKMLKWARLHGCPWDECVYDAALSNGNLTMMKWIKSQMLRLADPYFAARANKMGQLEILKWILEHSDGNVFWSDYYFSSSNWTYTQFTAMKFLVSNVAVSESARFTRWIQAVEDHISQLNLAFDLIPIIQCYI